MIVLVTLGCATPGAAPMTGESLTTSIREIGAVVRVGPNAVEFDYEGVAIACVFDVVHDRMRLIAPIAERSAVGDEHLAVMLAANFHTTLDARYAIGGEVVYAAYLHPLSALTRSQLESAIRQVAALTRNFGSTWSSDELVFGTERGEGI